MELATEALSYNNQNIASEAPKLLLCSSIASVSDQGSNKGVTPLAGKILLFQGILLYLDGPQETLRAMRLY